MSTVYLFRVDGAKDNDDFFNALCQSASHVYAGVDFRVGAAGWIPDLVKIVQQSPDRCSLTLIELEATKAAALASYRKYLPENSAHILSAFKNYLDRVIRQCRSTADPRESEFARLKVALSQVSHVTVSAAGALRSSARFVEELPLIDQPRLTDQPRDVQVVEENKSRTFRGVLRLSAHEAKALTRCIMILDAVIRHRDQSGATFHTWRGRTRTQPLKRLLKEDGKDRPALHRLIFETRNSGVTLDFDPVLSVLAALWSDARKAPIDSERAHSLINRYFSIASNIKNHEQMAVIFETARKHVSQADIGQ